MEKLLEFLKKWRAEGSLTFEFSPGSKRPADYHFVCRIWDKDLGMVGCVSDTEDRAVEGAILEYNAALARFTSQA